MDCSPPGSSVYGIFQARILEWVAIPFSWGSSQLRDRTQVSCIAGVFFFFFFSHLSHQKSPIEINLQNRKRLTTLRNKLMVASEERIVGKFGMELYPLVCSKQVPTRIYCMALGTLLSLACWSGWEWSLGGVWIHVYVWLSPFTFHQKLS